ncbi:MAG: M56 family metallopeptidase [Oscillospiraceae bacterium]|nr:M56 family metallopeptidase [Oscillospiraceae bacterium]
MSGLIRTVLVMSVSGSIVAALLFALKPLIRNRLPKSAQYYLWMVAVAALLVPVSVIVKLPPAANNTPVSPGGLAERFVVAAQEELLNRRPPPSAEDARHTPEQASGPVSLDAAPFIYPIGAAAVLLYHMAAYAVFAGKLRRSGRKIGADCAVSVYRSKKADAPMLIGLFKPAVILPEREYTEAQLKAVLLHELTHLRRKDILVKWLSVIACAVHWFNPVVWAARREIDRACELACDETVIRGLDADGKRNYGDTLIYFASESKASVFSTAMRAEKKALKERLGAIMKSKRYTRAAAVMSAILLAAAVLSACVLGAGRTEDGVKAEEPASGPESTGITDAAPPPFDYENTPEQQQQQTQTPPPAQYQTEADFLNSVDGIAFQSAAYQAAKALLRADAEALSAHMLDPSDAQDAVRGMTDIFDSLEYIILIWSLESIRSENEINASYRFQINDEDSVSYVSMELVRTNDFWKVRGLWMEG